VGPDDGPDATGFERSCDAIHRIRLSSAHAFDGDYRPLRNVLKLIANVWSIARLIGRYRPDIVYSNTSAVMAGAIAAKLRGVPHVWHIHENVQTCRLEFVLSPAAMRRLIGHLSARIIFVTDLALRSLYPEGHDKAIVIHNGIDAGAVRCVHADSQRQRGQQTVRRLGFFGTLSDRKGADVLVRALPLVLSAYPTCMLELWGTGDAGYVRSLAALSRSLGVADRMTFQGYCENVYIMLAGYDLVTVPSRTESFSLVALEAMAAGVPLVVTRCGGPEEFVEDGVDGTVVAAGDHAALAQAIIGVFDAPRRATAMARKSREKVVRDFGLSAKLDAILRELERQAGARLSRSSPTPTRAPMRHG
jgi:glycosyltransferase involved in cell wall biosynthesis